MRCINFDPVIYIGLDQYTSLVISMQFLAIMHVSKIKQYGWLIYDELLDCLGDLIHNFRY